MIKQHIKRGLIGMSLVSVLAACSSSSGSGGMGGMKGMDNNATPMMNATAMPMANATAMPMGGMTEIQFIDGMMVHHQGAIDMATEAVTRATRPEVRDLAQKIIAAQQPEIKQLQEWRTAWYANEPVTDQAMLESMGMGTMKTPADTTKEYDQQFLTAMIGHHNGAIQMATAIKDTATHPELKTFAEKVIADQTGEIKQMEEWLKMWYKQ